MIKMIVRNQALFPDSEIAEAPLVSIIILNFNGQDLLHECLRSVFETNYPNYEIIVVDNASTDESCKIVEKEFGSETHFREW